jgi:hypothetical protein
MRILLIYSLLIISGLSLAAQVKNSKIPLDKTAYNSWTQLGDALISSDGKFIAYSISNAPLGRSTQWKILQQSKLCLFD